MADRFQLHPTIKVIAANAVGLFIGLMSGERQVKIYNAIGLTSSIAFGLGINGFIPFPTGLNMPLWLAVVLTGCGIAGCIAAPYLRRRLAGVSN